MKNSLKMGIIALAITSTLTSCIDSESSAERVISEGLRFNESTLPYDGGLLVANFGCDELNPLNNEGRGYIAFLKGDKVSPFIPNDGILSAPKGMLIKGDYLLICDVNKLVAYKLSDLKAAPQVLPLGEGELFANDLTSKGDEIYFSVTNSGNIFKLRSSDLENLADAEPELWCNVVGANGLLISGSTLYVASYPADGVTTEANVIYAIRDLTSPRAERLTSKAGQWDGLAISEDGGTLYSSSWAPAEMVSIDIESGVVTPLDFETEFIGAADFSLVDGSLYIPDLPNSVVIIKKVE
ncbi:MAG: hypothetical protein R3Y16_00270 [Rikenellaceae bacterium]